MSSLTPTNLVMRIAEPGHPTVPGPAVAAAVAGFAHSMIAVAGEFEFDPQDLVDDRDRATLLAAAIGGLINAGYRVERVDGTLSIYSPLPADAPGALDQVAALIDPGKAQRAVAELVAYLGARDSWDGGDLAACVDETLSRAVTGVPQVPAFQDQSTPLQIYWSSVAGHGDFA